MHNPESITLSGRVKDDLEIGGLMQTRGDIFIRLKCTYNVHRLDDTPETAVKGVSIASLSAKMRLGLC